MKRALEKNAHGARVKWDEDNLRENEQIKANLHCTKIDEPKTPYLRGIEPDGDESFAADAEGMSPLNLEEDDEEVLPGEDSLPSAEEGCSPAALSNGNANGLNASQLQNEDDLKQIELKRSMDGIHDSQHNDLHVHFRNSTEAEQMNSDGEGEDGRDEKRRCFEEHRKEHYNMKEALKRGKELIGDEDE